MKILRLLKCLFLLLVIIPVLGRSELQPADFTENIRTYTRDNEFDYIQWTLNAIFIKASQSAINIPLYLDQAQQHSIVMNYLQIINDIEEINTKIDIIYADPQIADPEIASAHLVDRLEQLTQTRSWIEPISETILQQQISVELDKFGISFEGQPVPPVLYHITSMPKALIVSPRDEIKQELDISLNADLAINQITNLEQKVEISKDVSALIVDIGGVGTYPTMVMSSTDLSWLIEVISHEWTHNYLTLHPLGLNYYTSSDLRTMNETTANLSGKEIAEEVIIDFYPELYVEDQAQMTAAETGSSADGQIVEENVFDFRSEMHLTRVNVDRMLADGQISEAEKYMELRRQEFWAHGYHIRRLNQAYFAFHGAYADEPGGASGTDPVGPDVQLLRQQSDNLAEFLKTIASMSSYEDLKSKLKEAETP